MLIGPQNSPTDEQLLARWTDVRARIARAARAAGRDEQQVTLVAVSKGHDAASVRRLAVAGQRHFGENYLQEALAKQSALADLDLCWHFIGRLQANKTRPVAEQFSWVHGVERARIAERLSAQRPHYAPPLELCLQVNIVADADKAGVTPEQALELARAVHQLPRLRLRGLMCMLPESLDSPPRRAAYQALQALAGQLRASGLPLDTLSMGMSDDFEIAIAAGATLVRVGTAVFGPRPAARG